MLPEDNNNHQNGGPSLLWTIKTAFNNYQTTIDKYENLLLKTSDLNNTIINKLGELNTRLEKLPDKSVLIDFDEKISKILDKLTKMILIISIVGGIGITTYIMVNNHIDKRLERTISEQINQLICNDRIVKESSDDYMKTPRLNKLMNKQINNLMKDQE